MAGACPQSWPPISRQKGSSHSPEGVTASLLDTILAMPPSASNEYTTCRAQNAAHFGDPDLQQPAVVRPFGQQGTLPIHYKDLCSQCCSSLML